VQNIQANGLAIRRMVKANRYGPMELVMKANGLIIYLRDMVLLKRVMEMYCRVSGKKEGLMVLLLLFSI